MANAPSTTESVATPVARPRKTARGPVAIVDIGSNSVRLVVYETQSRTPATLYNEKAICGIGRDMVTTGRLHPDGCAMALDTLARFKMLTDGYDVPIREAVATAAARDASNGADFVRRAEAAWGAPVRVLSGEEEARLAALGVIAGVPAANGLVADLGGGSLDMVTVRGGETGEASTLPFGPLRLMDLAKGDPDRARELVDTGLARAPGLKGLEGRALYAVGGIWRSFARVDMDDHHYPLHVLQQYAIPRGRALRIAKALAVQSKRSLEKMRVVSKRRAESLPYGAIVLERILLTTNLSEVIVSAYGLREGMLFAQLSSDERAKDPLIEFASGVNQRMSRTPDHANELFRWSEPLFPEETVEMRRVRQAACLFSDVGWRRHPDERAHGAFNQVLTAPFSGADHRERALMATSVFYRYSGDEEFPRELENAELLDEQDKHVARRMGLAARLAVSLSASAAGELPHYKLRLTPTRVLLEVPRRRQVVAGEPVQKRLGALAAAFGRKGEILIG